MTAAWVAHVFSVLEAQQNDAGAQAQPALGLAQVLALDQALDLVPGDARQSAPRRSLMTHARQTLTDQLSAAGWEPGGSPAQAQWRRALKQLGVVRGVQAQ